MSRRLINIYSWLLETISNHKSISRSEINRLWVNNEELSGGKPIPRRTFYAYLRAMEEMFDVTVNCNPTTYEYSLDDDGSTKADIASWLLNSMAVNGALANSRSVSSRIMLEEAVSSPSMLSAIITALKENRVIRFTYQAFDRSRGSQVTLEPYFVRMFDRRWYVIGIDRSRRSIRTYSFDRIVDLQILTETFVFPDIDVEEFFSDSFGIYSDQSQAQKIKLRVSYDQAKYFRRLPLHHSQKEQMHDTWSLFEYTMRVTPDLVQEILRYGPKVEVVAPQTLRTMIKTSLEEGLAKYK